VEAESVEKIHKPFRLTDYSRVYQLGLS